MKSICKVFRFSIVFALIAILASSCINCIEGEGPEVKETQELDDFNELEVDLDADVVIHIGDRSAVSISSQENLLKAISTDVLGNSLVIGARPCINTEGRVRIEVTTTSLSEIKLNGSADITCMDELHSDDLELKINGSGNIMADIFANQLNVKINGSGNVIIGGSAKEADVVVNGSGDVRAESLQAYKADIRINGSGDVGINALNDLKVTVKGSGDVKYSGDPTLKTSISGSGSVTKLN
ncbi:MAG: head GIN domain-containing protein [Bacteroidales bacterium]|jgi:hypothetical protein|nr:head GIN domain-containing protein [Bacteroidales bacterium]